MVSGPLRQALYAALTVPVLLASRLPEIAIVPLSQAMVWSIAAPASAPLGPACASASVRSACARRRITPAAPAGCTDAEASDCAETPASRLLLPPAVLAPMTLAALALAVVDVTAAPVVAPV